MAEEEEEDEEGEVPVPLEPCPLVPISGLPNSSDILSYIFNSRVDKGLTFFMSASALSSETVILVESLIITGPEGFVDITTRSILWPMTLIGIVSPFVINCPFRYSPRYSSAPTILSGSVGANVILLASFDCTFLTSTESLIPTSNLFLV